MKDKTSELNETLEIRGIQKQSSWEISISAEGDDTGIIFDIDSTGQVNCTPPLFSGFSFGLIKFRAITTGV